MLEILVAFIFILSAFVVAVLFAQRPHLALYALEGSVSFMGLNVHVGVTFYLSRVVIILFIISLLIRIAMKQRVELMTRFSNRYVKLFCLILFFQIVSVSFSNQVLDGFRQIFIYLSVMAIFLFVIVIVNQVSVLIKAITFYLVSGGVQGFYGMYQLIGGPFSWPTYQTLMVGIPMMSNDRMVNGYFYSGSFGIFRPSGFFPNDVNHFAGYMVGILLIGLAVIVYKRRIGWLFPIIFFGGASLIFSLSRSGLIAFLLFGLPTLLFLLSHVTNSIFRCALRFIIVFSLILLPVDLVASQVLSSFNIELPNVQELISTRLIDLANPGENLTGGSMEAHIMTRLMGLEAFASSPLIGVGLGVNASPWYPSPSAEIGWAGSHSHHLDILGQTGIIGAGLQFLFMAMVGTYMWRGLFVTREPSLERHLLAGLLAAYIAILLGNFLYHYFLHDFVWFLMGIGVALSRLLILDARQMGSSGFSVGHRGRV